ncbi:RNA polymerase sigma factor [Dactylosporangium sucinum]|uniref:Uncharacterized protein n=1 Tax=Dactylosporangium sucinum TaxID=1424081 RepID=A0A917UFU5_9ACTN|nr:sigma-70 family RNA polymerase sigma factor [Dactylosporangium sucinum]GGM89931.1 hypothetical protein GCM10007977_109990 [Dactylosporangium sucinum]
MLTREGGAYLTGQLLREEGVDVPVGASTPDRAAFEEFYRGHVRQLFSYLLSVGADSAEAADVAQETMIDIYTRWYQIEHPERYMFTVARRAYWKLRDHAHRQTPTSDIEAVIDAVNGVEVPSAETSVMSRMVVAEAIAALPDRQRTVLAMLIDGASTEEIARRTGSTPSSVGSSLHLARRRLRHWLEQREQTADAPRIPRQRTGEHEQLPARALSRIPRQRTGEESPRTDWRAAQEQLAVQLRQVHREAGSPSFQELASRVPDGPSKSTMFRVVSGRHVPNWPTVRSFLLACNVEEHEIDTLWHQRWVDLTALADAANQAEDQSAV